MNQLNHARELINKIFDASNKKTPEIQSAIEEVTDIAEHFREKSKIGTIRIRLKADNIAEYLMESLTRACIH